MMNNKNKILVLLALIFIVGTIGIVYAALSRSLSISADVKIESGRINVFFEGVTTSTTVRNGAVVLSEGTINDAIISGLSVKLVPGSSVSTSFTAINRSESLYAKLYDISNNFFSDLTLINGQNEYNLFSLDDSSIIQLISEAIGLDPTSETFSDDLSESLINLFSSLSLQIYKAQGNVLIYSSTFGNQTISNFSTCSILNPYDQQNVSGSEESYIAEISLSNDVLQFNEGWSIRMEDLNLGFVYNQVANNN